MATDLVFTGSPLTTQPIGLVFNESDAPNLDRSLTASGSLPQLAGAAAFAPAVVVAGLGMLPLLSGQAIFGGATLLTASGSLPELSGSCALLYNSDTQRPLVGTVRDSFQNGLNLETGVASRMQDGERIKVSTTGTYQDALREEVGFEARWQQARSLRMQIDGRYQQGLKERNGFDDGFTDAQRRRQGARDRYQQGVKVGNGFASRFQDTLRLRNWSAARFQQASPYSIFLESRVQKARKFGHGVGSRYQEAIRPNAGLWFRPPVDPLTPCYIPDPNLVFVAPWSADTNLIFICETHGGPGPDPDPDAVVVVPVRRVYVVLNSATLHRVDGNVPLPTFGMSMSLDVESWTWSFSASLPGAAIADLEPDSDGTPVLVEAVINTVAYRFLVEKIGRERAFAQDGIRITGRGMAAELDAPSAPIMNFGNVASRTAQQLMGDVLSINGVPLPDWTVDWQLEDWLVPGGVWTKQGTYIDALNEIVAAAGGYLQPTASTKGLKALPRFPALPWTWSEVTPDFELPSAAIVRESIDWVEKPRYDRVYVSGQRDGVLGNVKREGTAGLVLAPMVTDSLITSSVAARQRGGAILADTGRIANYSLRMPAGVKDTDDISVGIIPPGKFVRYVDGGVTKLGITRSVNVEVGIPDIYQTISVEVHE